MKLITSNHVVFGQSIEHSLQSKMEFLKELRLKDEELGHGFNFVVHHGLQGVLQNIMFLDSSGVKRDWIGIIIVAFLCIFSYNVKNNFKKKMAFLKNETIGSKNIF